MLNSKQRAKLRGIASTIDATTIVGKEGLTETVLAQIDRELTARELVKGKVLENSLVSPKEACAFLAEKLRAEGVQVVGKGQVRQQIDPHVPIRGIFVLRQSKTEEYDKDAEQIAGQDSGGTFFVIFTNGR